MNRRDALAALVALPSLTRVSVATLKADDVIVAECTGRVSLAMRATIAAQLHEVWPGRRILICDGDLRLKVVAGDPR